MLDAKQNSIDNHNRFVANVVENQKVWFIVTPDGLIAGCPSQQEIKDGEEELMVLPFWSDEAYAKNHLKENWSNFSVESVDFDAFIDEILQDLYHNQILVGTNWNTHLMGMELDPLDLAMELDAKFKEKNA